MTFMKVGKIGGRTDFPGALRIALVYRDCQLHRGKMKERGHSLGSNLPYIQF